MSATKDFEIIVFGATSFVGKILCDYLCNEYTEANLRWAMAARSHSVCCGGYLFTLWLVRERA